MASDGPGKYRERKSRTTKPYDRPKGIIRRVTDSVTGLFSTSWLSGWIGSEEDEESSDQQAGPSQTSTLAPAGESFIFAQPVTARRPFRPIYPEEGETENNSQQPLGINEGASTSSGVRMSVPAAPSIGVSTTTNRSVQLSGDTPRPSMTGRRLPIISSTPSPMFTTRTKSQLEPRSLPLLTTSTPTGDDGSEMSESSVDTGVDASVIPRPDERDYQHELLELDEESLQTLRDSLTKSVPAVPGAQPVNALPSLEETRKRPRDLEADNTSVRAEGSVSSKSLFSEAGDIVHGQPQPTGMGSKRPRFNVSLYGSPILSDRSVLSDSTFKSSPFYPGKTMYGGASACRSRRLQARTLHQTARTQVRAKAAPESTDDGGLSQAARRILESLEQMSTPISDAKRIPTPTPGQRGSFLDATPSYTAAFHRHRPALRPSAPPISRLLTPTKLVIQENLATSLLASNSTSTSGSPAHKKSTKLEEVTHPTTEVTVSEQGETKKPAEVSTESCAASPFSKAAAEATAKFKPSKAVVSSTTAAALPPEEVKFVLPTSSASLSKFEFTPKPATTVSSFTSDSPQPSKKVGGKIRSKIVDSGRSSTRHEDEAVEEPQLPSVPLTMFSLPKIDLSVPSPVTSSPTNITSSSKGFKFSIPKIVDTQSACETLPSAPKFTFRNPVLVNEGNLFADSSCTTVAPTSVMFNSSSPTLVPKLKTNAKKVVPTIPTAEKLKEGSILDILKPKGNISDKQCTTSSLSNNLEENVETLDTPNSKTLVTSLPKSVSEQSVNSVAEETETSHEVHGFDSAFKKSSDEWECSVCMVRNKNSAVKCIACETQKPEQILYSSTEETTSYVVNVEENPPPLSGSVIGWGDAFKKSADEWECDTCMLQNKDSVEKCVACETPKPGNKTVSVVTQEVSKVIDDKEEKANLGFGSAFAKGKGEWECDTCLVRNKSDATKCISCETPRPGAANVSQAITGNFKFGVNTNDLSSTNSTFKFGLSNSQSEFKSSGFDFGVSAKSTEDSNSQGNSGFKFGVPAEKPNALTGFSFGSNSESVQSKEKKQCTSVGFSFGVQSSDSKEKEIIEPPSELCHTEAEVADVSKSEITNEPPSELPTSKSNENSSESVTAPNPVFQLDSGSKTEVAFSFGSGTQVKSTTKEDQGKDHTKENDSSVELKSGNDLDALKKEKDPKPSDIFSSGSKADENLDGVEKPSFMFNNVISTPCKNNDKNANPISFGVSKVTDSESESSSTQIFGASMGENAAPTAGTFTFSDKELKTTAAPAFSFNPPSINKEETKAAPVFTFSTKRDSSDVGEPAKKMTFSSPSVGGINNGVSASPSLFNFGSKENKLSVGSGFREIPSSTPAFGARAPASNSTPSFQFGNSNPPAPAATAPAPAFGNPAPAFGSATPAFGSNNSSSTQNFVFGQPPEKTSAGYDFGQAANNTGTQGYNFASAQSNSRIFLFGQSPANSTSQVGIFKFGTTNTEVPTPAPSVGPDNSFNSPAPTSRRVMKKAIRRTPRK